MEVIRKLQGTVCKLWAREARRASRPRHSDGRSARRVGVGLVARLKVREDRNFFCEVTDATREGVGLQMSERLAPGTVAVVEIPFNGHRLRTGVRICWTRDRRGCVEAGGSFLKGAEAGTLHDFELYLRWCETFHRAA